MLDVMRCRPIVFDGPKPQMCVLITRNITTVVVFGHMRLLLQNLNKHFKIRTIIGTYNVIIRSIELCVDIPCH